MQRIDDSYHLLRNFRFGFVVIGENHWRWNPSRAADPLFRLSRSSCQIRISQKPARAGQRMPNFVMPAHQRRSSHRGPFRQIASASADDVSAERPGRKSKFFDAMSHRGKSAPRLTCSRKSSLPKENWIGKKRDSDIASFPSKKNISCLHDHATRSYLDQTNAAQAGLRPLKGRCS